MLGKSQGTQQELSDAFGAFEHALRETLIREARHAVDTAVGQLAGRGLEFRIEAIGFDLTINHLRISYGGTRGPHQGAGSGPSRRAPSRRAARARTPPSSHAASGRPSGATRAALLDAFANGDELSIGAIRSSLEAQGIETSDDNLHQHLRRLVVGGELQRAGRGLYVRRAGFEAVGDA
jgi:hypothetical protein